ncbi:MAG: D-isomer specific 2-hydroxyacid dehydrogenase NAD-binding protein [Parcubacteria group bacterium Athens1014_10]|nr:MAG: D-isomer specific 2-hydroxyacid dehydrogenase NAD-binding protein [Parcubacteria group bacterium Athens1014_10]TSD05004.1 MAG: D-isomer specific 2-hydroxyacid dehydrogenase NAD-binding protein [Parcubacteria group bacterium Athens0714_12]
MSKTKIVFFETENWEKEYLIKNLKNLELKFFNEPLEDKHFAVIKDYSIISPFIYSKFTREVFNLLPKVKLISTRSTGFDHIDISEAKKKKIKVCNVPYYGENTVAEHTFALILALSRKLCLSWERSKKGDFSPEGLMGFDLKGKTLGIIGMGHIGQHVARIAKGFEMKVITFDVRKDLKLAKELNFTYVSFEKLLKTADIISLHAPYNKETHHLLNNKNIHLIKKGAYLINTARGALIETEALIKALGEKILAGIALDVLEEECFIKEERQLLSKEFPKECDLKTVLRNHLLLQQENVIITPHNAFNSKEALERILETTVSNINSFLNNKPVNLV